MAPRRHSGSQRRDEEERSANVAGEHPVEGGHVELGRRGEARDTGVVDQDVGLAGVGRQALHAGWVAEVGTDEAGLAARGGDHLDRLRATRRVAAMNEDLGPVAGQLQRDRAADARRRAGHQRALPFKAVLSDR